MPGVQCVICLSSDTSSDEWCMLRDCGHVFHVHCVVQSLEHARRCPQCRQEYSRRKYTTANPPYQRIFFEFSDEPASQPMPSGGCGEGTAGGSCGGGNGSGTAADVQQISFLQGQLRDKDRRIQAISTQLAEQEERAQQLELDLGQARASVREREAKVQEKILELSREHKQVKGLANQIANLTAQLKAESARSSLMALATDQGLAGHALAAEVDKLVRLGLKAPHDFWEKLMSERSQTIMANSNRHSREKKALEQRQQQLQAELSQLQEQVATLKRSLSAARQQQAGVPAAAAAHDTQPDVRQHSSTTASRRPGRRFGGSEGQPAGAAATAAAGEEDPLVHTYGLLNMRQAELAAATASRHDRSQQQQQQQQQQAPQREVAAALEAEEEEEEEEEVVVLLDGSEEQVDLSDGGCFSEVESESEGEEQRQQTAASQQQHGTRAPFMQQQPQQQQPQQQQQQTASGSMLGKRSFLGSSQCSAFSKPDENSRSMPLLATAGPGRVASQQAPGRSFIRNAATASVGIERGKYISSGPDGKGGVATAYQGSGSGAPVRLLAQKHINAMHHVGSKKARSRPASNSSSDTAAAQALRRNNALPITSFFNRSQ